MQGLVCEGGGGRGGLPDLGEGGTAQPGDEAAESGGSHFGGCCQWQWQLRRMACVGDKAASFLYSLCGRQRLLFGRGEGEKEGKI